MANRYTPIDLNTTAPYYNAYFATQEGTGISAVYGGRKYMDVMDGAGFADVFKSAFKAVAPTLKRVGASAIKSLGKAAVGVAKDALDGKNVGQSAIRGLKRTAGDVLDDMVGGGEDEDYEEQDYRPPPKRSAKRARRGRKGGKRTGGTRDVFS